MSSLVFFQLNELNLLQKILILAASGVIAIFSQIMRRIIKSDYEEIKNTQIVSLDKFRNSTDNSENLLLTGKFISEYNNYSYLFRDFSLSTLYYQRPNILFDFFSPKLMQICSLQHQSSYNARNGQLERTNPLLDSHLSFLFFLGLRSAFHFNIHLHTGFFFMKELNAHEYFLNHDVIGLYGKKSNKVTSLFSIMEFTPSIIFQGNKLTVMKAIKNELTKLNNIAICSSIFFVVLGVVSPLIDLLKNKIVKRYLDFDMRSNTPFADARENCSKCKVNIANVVFIDCNHFMFCNQCFLKENKICKICKIVNPNFIVIDQVKN